MNHTTKVFCFILFMGFVPAQAAFASADEDLITAALICNVAAAKKALAADGNPTYKTYIAEKMLDSLMLATIKKCPKVVEILLKNGASAQTYFDGSEGPMYAFEVATNLGDFKTLKLLIEHDESIRAQIGECRMLSHRPVKTLKFLKTYGADMSLQHCLPTSGWHPLHRAIEDGDIEVVKFFLANGADPEAPGYEGALPLTIANANNRRNIAKMLEAAISKKKKADK